MTAMNLTNRYTGAVLFTCELPPDVAEQSYSLRLGFAIQEAVKARANLAGANLAGANLARANLADANLARAYLAPDLSTQLILQAHDAIFERGPRKLGWYRVEIESVHDRQRHYVDVEGFDEFEATREALDQNKHASSAKIVRRYYDGEKLLGNW